MTFSPELVITILVNVLTVGASYVSLRVQLEHRMTKLETHLDMLVSSRGVRRRKHEDHHDDHHE